MAVDLVGNDRLFIIIIIVLLSWKQGEQSRQHNYQEESVVYS